LGAFFAAQKTGLSACIFFAYGKKGYRFYPLRCLKTASVPFLSCEFLRSKNSWMYHSRPPAGLTKVPGTPGTKKPRSLRPVVKIRCASKGAPL
jgi:hypothetical protein